MKIIGVQCHLAEVKLNNIDECVIKIAGIHERNKNRMTKRVRNLVNLAKARTNGYKIIDKKDCLTLTRIISSLNHVIIPDKVGKNYFNLVNSLDCYSLLYCKLDHYSIRSLATRRQCYTFRNIDKLPW